MIFKTEFSPLLEDYDISGRLTLQAIVKYFENSGSRHSDAAGDPTLAVSESQGVAWVLTDWKISVDEFPRYGQRIFVETWSEGLTGAFGTSRNFFLYADGEKRGEGTSRWIRFDIRKGRPIKVEQGLLDRYGPEPGKTVFGGGRLERIEIPERFLSEKKIALRRSDFDFNRHVHNLNYLDFALEALPEEALKSAAFKKLRVGYKTALKEGDGALVKCAPAMPNAAENKTDGAENGAQAFVAAIYSDGGTLACAVELR